MKSKCEGRFKRFQKSFGVNSLSELRATVFDTDLLWVLEYWELIDANQHERLSICFTMRNNAAHPGEAPITDVNLASAFSDLKNIIFDNPKFKLARAWMDVRAISKDAQLSTSAMAKFFLRARRKGIVERKIVVNGFSKLQLWRRIM
jgi:hypothetical protein